MTEIDVELCMEEFVAKVEVEDQEKLELEYGVEIAPEAVVYACRIIRQYPDAFQFNFRGTLDDSQRAILQIKVVELLDEACLRLRQRFDYSREGEDELEVGEYRLHRALVELGEIEKEREPSTQKWRDRVAKEREELNDVWNTLEIKWLELQASRQRYDIRAREALLLERMREGLVYYLNEERTKENFSWILQWLDEHVTELLYTTRKDFKHELTVSSHVIAVAASLFIDAPPPQLLSDSLLQNPESIRRVIGQDHVLLAVSAALSRQRPPRRPIGSFIFMCGSGCGRTEFAKLLATLVFGKKDMLTEFDLEKYTGPNSVSRLRGVLCSQIEPGKKGELGVKKRHIGVVLFDNVDKAPGTIIDLLTQIIGFGHLVDGNGNTVDFTNTMIIMTTNIGCDQLWPWNCKCADEVQKFPVKEGLFDDAWERNHNSCYLSLLRETKNHFGPQFLEYVDDVIGFRSLSSQQLKAVARLQLRDLALCIIQKGIIIYSSEAALDVIVRRSTWPGDRIKGGEKIRMWLEQNLVPVLFEMISKNEISDLSIMYIEASVQTDQLSFRMEKTGRLLEERDVNQLASLKELRLMYQKEKERAKRIYMLRKFQNKLLASANAGFDHVTHVIQDLVNLIQDLITIPGSIIRSFLDNPKKVAMAALNEDEVRQNKRAKRGTK
ncbi:PREDICTED: chaperone protein ClpB1-like isoform X2 [Fragaria vesca subsp. vesca]|uniref:chaperone protein ClpB1-like isoform X2 n=1 Tax=Fragaria vesca subsp. vesca TaxID=101020 RepID=UPI0002C35FE6|nr:PREDICTED: chaperone protein ClpB1-like isoform X2 [Fragaria vesca subsp. vesca]